MRERVIKGPIPLSWVTAAGALTGKALAVGMHLWFLAGLRGTETVAVNLSRLGLPQATASRGLKALRAAGLVSVVHRDGRPSLVTLIPVVGAPSDSRR